MRKIPTPPQLRERLRALVNEHGSVFAAAEALAVEPRDLRRFIDRDSTMDATAVYFETKIQAYEDLPSDFARKQELASLACDLVARTTQTADIIRSEGLKGRDLEQLDTLFHYVKGVPATDGRVLVAHVTDPKRSTVWRVEPPPEPHTKPASVRPALEALETARG